ncbi:MAG TPA: peptidylprolyl isomerase [Legionellales bacterium]|nr:peptidylprolyl isomerase [Legionellales bacterium]HCA90242.1 peptidylprolyl isomerase [Legionellales bacterium]|tara:strand:- start:2092 stop:3957 length:1866 start_codon:yes stop_codon:yes gene_type:complete
MLQKLNERIQGWIAWIVIVLIAFTFTLFGVEYYMQSQQRTDDVVVTINGYPITKQSFETSFRRVREQAPANLNHASAEKIKKQVLDDLILTKVAQQAAYKNGFLISPRQADATILAISQFQQQGHFSKLLYQQALRDAFFTPFSFQQEVMQGMLLNQQQFTFAGGAFVLPDDINNFAKLYFETRDYQYTIIPQAWFMHAENISLKRMQQYYQHHPQAFIEPEKVIIEFVRLNLSTVKAHTQVNAQEIAQYYKDNQANFMEPAKWRVAHILLSLPENPTEQQKADIQAKAQTLYQALAQSKISFDKAVSQYSDDAFTKPEKGLLPELSLGDKVWDKVLISLTKPQQIAQPFKTAKGYEIIQLISYKAERPKPLSDVEPQIKDQLLTEKATERYTHLLEELTELSYQTSDTLEPIAQALHLPLEKTKAFGRNDTFKTGILAYPQVKAAAFSNDVLELQNNSEAVALDDNSVVVLRIKQRIPAHKQTFAKVKPDIQQLLAKKQASQQAHAFIQALSNDQQKAQTLLPAKKQLAWQTIYKAERDAQKPSAIINQLAFKLAAVHNQTSLVLPDGNVVLVRLNAINPGHAPTTEAEQKGMMTQLAGMYGVIDYNGYVHALIKQAHIK